MTQSKTNSNDNFFNGYYKEVWRKLIPHGLSEAECSFIEDIAGLQANDTILDLMCGYGRHSLELARRGYAVTAIDNLPDYIEEIQQKAVAENVPVNAMVSGALQFETTQTFRSIICMGNSFAFFDKEEAIGLLKKIADCLTPDGVFLINTWMIAEIAIKHFTEREWHPVDGFKYLLDYQFHLQPSRIESEHTLITPQGTLEVLHGVDYIFTLQELNDMFKVAGLYLSEVYSTPRKKPFKLGDNKAYIVAKKQP